MTAESHLPGPCILLQFKVNKKFFGSWQVNPICGSSCPASLTVCWPAQGSSVKSRGC